MLLGCALIELAEGPTECGNFLGSSFSYNLVQACISIAAWFQLLCPNHPYVVLFI